MRPSPIAAARQQITAELAKIDYKEPEAVAGAPVGEPKEYVWIDDAAPPNAKLQGDTPWEFVAKDTSPVFSGEKASKRTAAGLSQHFFTEASPGLKVGEGDKLFTYVYLDPANPPKEIMLQWNDGVWEHRAYWGDDVIPWGAAGSASRLPVGTLPKPGEWTRLEVHASKHCQRFNLCRLAVGSIGCAARRRNGEGPDREAEHRARLRG